MPEPIRLLGPPDAPAYKTLRDTVLALHPAAFTSDAGTERLRPPESYLGRLGPGHAGTGFTLGAGNRGHLLGAVSCERDARTKVRHVARLVGMMVRPEAASRGLGRALLDTCLQRLRNGGDVGLVILSVTADNARAVRLYESAGFRCYGTLPRAIRVDGRDLDKTLMRLDLD